jgi:ATP adenylyltransferase
MLQEVNLAPTEAGDQPGAYNLLLTRRWMLLTPRVAESYAGISVNALGFAGCLLVHDRQQLALLKHVGPMTVLQQVACK